MKHKTVQVNPLKDNRVVLTVEQPVVRRSFAPGQHHHGSAKAYNRRDFKRFDNE